MKVRDIICVFLPCQLCCSLYLHCISLLHICFVRSAKQWLSHCVLAMLRQTGSSHVVASMWLNGWKHHAWPQTRRRFLSTSQERPRQITPPPSPLLA